MARYRRFKRIYSRIRLIVYIIFSLYAFVHVFPQGMRDLQLYVQKSEYETEIKRLNDENKNLMKKRDIANSAEWVEKIAREQLGLVKPGEIIEVTH